MASKKAGSIHDGWLIALKGAEASFKARKWKVTSVKMAPPATTAQLASVEKAIGVALPKQLRSALLFSSKLSFDWDAPEDSDAPFQSGGLGRALWDLKDVSRKSIDGWLEIYDEDDEFEEPHSRKMWNGHIAFAHLPNGDLLTIDASHSGAQPVRYFSHEIEGLHGRILAPDFDTFMSEYIALACPGNTHDDWFELCKGNRKQALLKASSTLGKKWLAYLKSDGSAPPKAAAAPKKPNVQANVAPKVVEARSEADKQLVAAAQKGNTKAVAAALAAGANPAAATRVTVKGGSMPGTYAMCAVDLAAKASNVALLEQLVAAGASVHTSNNALAFASEHADTKTVSWLLAHGAYPNARKHDTSSPLVGTLETLARSKATETKRLLANLEALLKAGADPNAKESLYPPLGISELAVPLLLKHGADPTLEINMDYPLQKAGSAAHVRALVKAGADPNAVSSHGGKEYPGRSALATHVRESKTKLDVIEALVAAGADPWVLDTNREHSAFQCVERLEHLKAIGKKLVPTQTDAKGNTAAMQLVDFSMLMLQGKALHAALEYLVKEKKVPINAQNKAGDTALHLAAASFTEPDVFRTLLKLGADKTLKNKKGELAVKRVSKKDTAVKKLLTVD